MEEETPIKGLTKWFKGLNTKSTSKLLLVYGEKGNIFRSKVERSFLRNCSVFC